MCWKSSPSPGHLLWLQGLSQVTCSPPPYPIEALGAAGLQQTLRPERGAGGQQPSPGPQIRPGAAASCLCGQILPKPGAGLRAELMQQPRGGTGIRAPRAPWCSQSQSARDTPGKCTVTAIVVVGTVGRRDRNKCLEVTFSSLEPILSILRTSSCILFSSGCWASRRKALGAPSWEQLSQSRRRQYPFVTGWGQAGRGASEPWGPRGHVRTERFLAVSAATRMERHCG